MHGKAYDENGELTERNTHRLGWSGYHIIRMMVSLSQCASFEYMTRMIMRKEIGRNNTKYSVWGKYISSQNPGTIHTILFVSVFSAWAETDYYGCCKQVAAGKRKTEREESDEAWKLVKLKWRREAEQEGNGSTCSRNGGKDAFHDKT